MRSLLIAFSLLAMLSCKQNTPKEEPTPINNPNHTETIYSHEVADSFSLFVDLPADYDANNPAKYPVVYLLDANFYFDMMAPVFRKYAEGGITQPVILVGVGYKDMAAMDSLRSRDYTYPQADPKYEMSQSGGADKFLAFMTKELIPKIDKQYKTDTANRMLAGHSLGGFFTMYALLQNMGKPNNPFHSYIAASPSLHYNDYYLLNRLKELPKQSNAPKANLYVTFGTLEEEEDADDPDIMKLDELSKSLKGIVSEKLSDVLVYKYETFSNLSHMETPIPSFIKGLQFSLDGQER